MKTVLRYFKAIHWLTVGNKAQKRKAKHEALRILLNIFGEFYIHEDNKLWLSDKNFIQTCKNLPGSNYFSWDRKYFLRELIRQTIGISGDIAECGCYKGASAYIMAQESQNTPIHLFDSFEGLSTPDKNDLPLFKDQFAWEKGNLKTNENITRHTLKEFDSIAIYKGWIPNRFKEVQNRRFRFVHIDVDLYQPTLDSLEFFYDKVNSKGIILLDDYGFTNCNGAYKAANEFMSNKSETILHSPTGQGIIFKF